MSKPLAKALEEVELEPGTYRCTVKGRSVVVRVSASLPESGPISIDENDIMLDPWIDMPRPGPSRRIKPQKTKLPIPDIPVIPTDNFEE